MRKSFIVIATLIGVAVASLFLGRQGKSEPPVTEEKKDQQTLSNKPMSVHYIDVGQGDAIFIETPNGKTMLIDGGKKSQGEKVVSFIKDKGYETVDYVVATHPDADHIGGLISVLEQLNVKRFIDSGKVHTTETYLTMLQLIDEKNIDFIVPKLGDAIDIDPEVEMMVVNAVEDASNNNEASIVVYAVHGQTSYLFTGDADVSIERQMMKDFNIPTTVLKAGHHGSDTSSALDFLQTVKPEVVVLSYGENNKYGHPHDSVLRNIEKVGSMIYSTAESGTITVTSDGKAYRVEAEPWNTLSGLININTASKEELQYLQGIGPTTADKIIQYRQKQPFRTTEEIMEVDGIGPKTYEQIELKIKVK